VPMMRRQSHASPRPFARPDRGPPFQPVQRLVAVYAVVGVTLAFTLLPWYHDSGRSPGGLSLPPVEYAWVWAPPHDEVTSERYAVEPKLATVQIVVACVLGFVAYGLAGRVRPRARSGPVLSKVPGVAPSCSSCLGPLPSGALKCPYCGHVN
jgi:hypothetical protein